MEAHAQAFCPLKVQMASVESGSDTEEEDFSTLKYVGDRPKKLNTHFFAYFKSRCPTQNSSFDLSVK